MAPRDPVADSSSARDRRPRPDAPASSHGIRLRTAALVGVAVILNVFLVVRGNWMGHGFPAQSMVASAVAGLFVLAGLNRVLKQFRPAWMLFPGELIALYSALAISTGLCASPYDWGGAVSGAITWPIWNATPGNGWEQVLWPNLPPWLMVTDRNALAGFYLGGASPYQRQVLLGWLQPALWWTAWGSALLWVSLCLNVIVRRRWSHDEQLPFPMTILPVQMSDPQATLFRSPLFWIGVVVAASIGLAQAIALLVPSLPVIPTGIDYSSYVANNRPWDAIRIAHFSWQPWHLGLAYLMPLELSFSLMVFSVFWRAEYILTRHLGWSVSSWGGFPYGEQQIMGAYLALFAIFVWLERRYLMQVLRKALGLPSYADDSEEAFSYRAAVLGALAGIGFIWWFLARTGMQQFVIALFLGGYFLTAMMMSRLRAQLGPPSNEMWGTMPDFALTQYPGTRSLHPRTLAVLGLLRPYLREQTANPAPVQLETLRMAQALKVKPKRLALMMALIAPLGVLAYFWASLHIGSDLGLGSGKVARGMIFHTRITVQTMEEWLTLPSPPDWGGTAAIGVGFLVTILLMAVKLRLPLWPLHPVAFPLGLDMTVDDMLPAITLTWLAKSLLLRYGGLRAHRTALPLFLGLIVGAGTVSVIRSALSAIFGIPI
jgi:hypothetical protein